MAAAVVPNRATTQVKVPPVVRYRQCSCRIGLPDSDPDRHCRNRANPFGATFFQTLLCDLHAKRRIECPTGYQHDRNER
jgi:hypothetical protein